ncbi:MAG: MGH1-like glycoside hydrolase domain-containing protein [Propioniciclava sp.]
MNIPEGIDAAASYIDLVAVPFTQPGSRLLIHSDGAGALVVRRAAYEVSATDAIVLTGVRVEDRHGAPLPLGAVGVDRIEIGGLTLALSGDELSVAGPMAARLVFEHAGVRTIEQIIPEETVVLTLTEDGVQVRRDGTHAHRLAHCQTWWQDWFADLPQVQAEFSASAAHHWWVLGVNQLALTGHVGTAVVPAKLGYLGLWQWDAYFIAIGLRHTRLDLATMQLEMALRHPQPSGQLPDVLHDGGILAASTDLPAADVDRLHQVGSPAADPHAAVPLTKPPLAALTITKLVEAGLRAEECVALLPAVIASQDWWLRDCPTVDGIPGYAHPYSSGLDDSPVFDAELPVATPDLVAYLELQDRLLADLLMAMDRLESASRHRDRAGQSHDQLLQLWVESERRFAARGASGLVAAHTIVDLVPLLTGSLPQRIVDALVADLTDPRTFGGGVVVPTVARSSGSFDAQAMWRGPVWVNTNWLIVEGLQRSGRPEEAAELARRTLSQVAASGGAYEYLDAETGACPARAVALFAWTAALWLDLAVRFAPATNDPTTTMRKVTA